MRTAAGVTMPVVIGFISAGVASVAAAVAVPGAYKVFLSFKIYRTAVLKASIFSLKGASFSIIARLV